MELNAELIDVTGYFGALRFVLFQLALQIGELLRCRGGAWRYHWNRRRFTATLAVQSHSSGRRIDHERAGAVLALAKEVPCVVYCTPTNRVHPVVTEQSVYQEGSPAA